MRLFADRRIRSLLLSLAAVLFVYALLIQLLSGKFSLSLFISSLAASVGIFLLCLRYFKKQDKLLENAVRSLDRFLAGQRDERIECDEDGELYKLFHSINALSSILNAQAEREQETNEFLKDTVSDISHQLKTPLAALTLYNELLAEADSMEEVRRFAASSGEELDRMDALVKNLLKLARLDAGTVVFEKHPENLAELMEELKSRFSCRAEAEQKELHFIGEDGRIECDAAWLTEAFGNILKNALDHTQAGGTISIEWKRNGNILTVVFRDNGSGIHPEDIGHIFKRFYRSRFSQDSSGVGLGLPLAKTVIEAHGGMIEVESEPGHGTKFTVSFLIPTEL